MNKLYYAICFAFILVGCGNNPVVAPLTSVPIDDTLIWFGDIRGELSLKSEEGNGLMAYTAGRLFGRQGDFPAELSSDDLPRIVIISAADGISPAVVTVGGGKGIKMAIDQGISQMQAALELNFSVRWVKLDIVQEVIPIPAATEQLELERSLYGLAFDRDSGQAFLPEELVSHTLLDSEFFYRWDNIEEYLFNWRYRGGNPSRNINELQDSKKFYRFRATSLFYDGESSYPLYRGHRLEAAVTPEYLIAAANRGGAYLSRSVYSDGSFVYSYFPKQDSYKDDYNILRHAGTIFSMMQLYEVNGDQDLLTAADEALNYLAGAVHICVKGMDTFGCVVEDGETKLGGNGLAILAMVKYMQVTGDQKYTPLVYELGAWIQNAQGEDGEFIVHKESFPQGENLDFVSEYYPGEAIFALTQLYEFDGNQAWLDTAEAAVDWLVEVRDAGKDYTDLPHDHWLLYGIRELYEYRPKDSHYIHAMRITQAILDAQNLNPEFPDWYGSYYNPPRSTPTATRSEALCSAYYLAIEKGDAIMAENILTAYQRNLEFQLSTQFNEESVMYLLDPEEAWGGFHQSLTNFEIRIDYVQHNISSLLCYVQIVSN